MFIIAVEVFKLSGGSHNTNEGLIKKYHVKTRTPYL